MAKVKTCAKQIKGASLSPYWTRVKYFTLVRFYTVSVLSGEKKILNVKAGYIRLGQKHIFLNVLKIGNNAETHYKI